ncbi:MAG TPA: R3H domain-containing nucleic acid-binding protein [Patescibacteria group bacterium]
MNNKERNEIILKLTCELLEKMNFGVENAFVEDMEGDENQVWVSITVSNPGGLIGFRGRNLAAIQLVLSLMAKNKLGEWVRIMLDINGYRAEQKTRLETMAKNLAQKVLATGTPAAMASMSSYERRICHMILSEIEGIVGESEGEGEDRHIVIKIKE